jgi:hypothetical protein
MNADMARMLLLVLEATPSCCVEAAVLLPPSSLWTDDVIAGSAVHGCFPILASPRLGKARRLGRLLVSYTCASALR